MSDLLTVTPLYVAALALVFSVLSIRVPLRRAAINAPWGDGGDVALATRIRVFGNLAEYLGVALIVMATMELRGLSETALHAFGAAMILFRLAHAASLDAQNPATPTRQALRFVGAFGTWAAITAGAVAVLWTYA